MTDFLENFRKELIQERQNILEELMSEEETLSHSSNYVEDIGEKAFENLEKDIINALSEQQRKSLEEINKALQKIENNTYGICESCKAEIELKRLEILPFARFCVKHKDQ